MSDVVSGAGRTLSEAERTAFQQLGLSPGNWGALVATPFFHRAGVRPPNLQQRSDAIHLETLRRELRTAPGMGEQTGQFWKRLAAGAPADLAEAGTRLLAWHLATDLTFGKREQVLRLTAAAAEQFLTGAPPRAAQTLVEDVRLLVDYYLPCAGFWPDSVPPWSYVPPPPAALLQSLDAALPAPLLTWPAVPVEQVPARFPALARLLGEPVGEWWGRSVPGRRAVERGAAALSFIERERAYAEVGLEWDRAAPGAGTAGALVANVREWADAVRKAVRATARAEPPAPAPRSKVVPALPSRPAPAPPSAPLTIVLRSTATGRELKLEDGMRVGRAEYRDALGEPAAGLAAADQFELVREEARAAWVVRTVGAPRFPTCYQGSEVGPEGCTLSAEGVISVGGRLELVVRFV